MTHTTAYVYHHMLFSVRGHPFMTSTRRGSGSGGRMWTGGGKPHVDLQTRKFKLESTDVILSSSHAKKLASFLPEFRLFAE